MRLYSILMFVLILNLVLGLTMSAMAGYDVTVKDENGNDKVIHKDLFLPNAAGIVSFPQNLNWINSGQAVMSNMSQCGNDISNGNIGLALISFTTAAFNFFKTALLLLISAFGSIPYFIMDLVGVDQSVAVMFAVPISVILGLLTAYTFFQIITGRNFTFVE